MGHESKDVCDSAVVVHCHYKPISVSLNVEDRDCLATLNGDRVCMRIKLTDIPDTAPVGGFDYGDEIPQPIDEIRVFIGVTTERRLLDNPHCSHYENDAG